MTAYTGDGTARSGVELQRRSSPQAVDLIADIEAMGGTQGHIARILNVTPASVSLWRRGERTPSRYNVQRLWRLRRDLTAWDVTDTKQGAA